MSQIQQFVPQNYGYVVGVIGLGHLMNIYLMIQVALARKKFNVQAPDLYADKDNKNAKEFNCIQRGHQNTLEMWAPVQIMMLVNGYLYPIYSAAFGLAFIIGKVIYAMGYAKGANKRQLGGIISHLGDFPLLILTFFSAVQMIKQQ